MQAAHLEGRALLTVAPPAWSARSEVCTSLLFGTTTKTYIQSLHYGRKVGHPGSALFPLPFSGILSTRWRSCTPQGNGSPRCSLPEPQPAAPSCRLPHKLLNVCVLKPFNAARAWDGHEVGVLRKDSCKCEVS